MAELNRRPDSPGEDPKPPPDGDRGGRPGRRTRPDAGQGGDQRGDRGGGWSRVGDARRPVPREAPSRTGVPRRPADGSGARPDERPGPDTGAGRSRTRRSWIRPVPREDRAASDTPPRTVRSDDRSQEITGLRDRSDSDRRDLTRLQADDPDHAGDRPTTADANGPGTPDDPGPPAPPDHPDDPEHDKPEEPGNADALQAENADLRKQLADAQAAKADAEAQRDAANARNAELESRIETVETETDAKLDAIRAEHAVELDAVKAESAAQLDEANARADAQDAKIDALTDKVDQLGAMLGDALKQMKIPEQQPEGSTADLGKRRVDEPTGVVADGNPIADAPKRPRTNLGAKAWEAGVSGGTLTAAIMEIGPHVPAYVVAVGAGVAAAGKPTMEFIRETKAWYQGWRKERNADRSEG